MVVRRADSDETVLRVGHLLPGRGQVEPTQVDLLNTVLGGSLTSRLNMNLRERNGFTYGVGSAMTLMRKHGFLAISAQVAREATTPALVETLREMNGLARRPVGRQELAKARALLVEDLPASAETLAGLSEAYLDLALHRERLSNLNRLPDRLALATPESVHALARRLLRADDATVVAVGEPPPDLEQTFGPAEIWDVDGRPRLTSG